MKYDIHEDDIFIAADGSKCGHLVTDIESFADVGDVLTIPFTAAGFDKTKTHNRIDAFKLAMVRYYKPESIPDWVPTALRQARLSRKQR